MHTRARHLWSRLEAYHGMIYFVPEADEEYTKLGLDRGSMGYFASRACAMGEVAPEVVIATFFNFEPTRIHREVPLAWQRTAASALYAARLRAVDLALSRLFGERLQAPDIVDAVTALRRACAACEPQGRALYAGHAAQPWPEAPHLALWHAITLMREYRGDGHVAELTRAGIGGCEALVIHAAAGAVPAAVLRATRGWTDDAWAAASAGVRQRGWIDDSDALTPAGIAHRAAIERCTDDLAAVPWAALTDTEADQLASLGAELTRAIVAAGTFSRLPQAR